MVPNTNQVTNMVFLFFISLKHPSKYVGKKPRKYTVPANPYQPPPPGSAQDQRIQVNNGNNKQQQVRVYREGGNMQGQGKQYSRVRLQVVDFFISIVSDSF